jgi:dynein heavy chain, axonemal
MTGLQLELQLFRLLIKSHAATDGSLMLAGILSLLQSAPHIVSMRAFAPLFTGKPSALNVRNLLAHSPRFQTLVRSINATVAEDFAAAAEYVTVFEGVRMIHDHRITWNADAYAAEAAGSARKVNLDLRKFRTWKAELDKMKVSQVCVLERCLTIEDSGISIRAETLNT